MLDSDRIRECLFSSFLPPIICEGVVVRDGTVQPLPWLDSAAVFPILFLGHARPVCFPARQPYIAAPRAPHGSGHARLLDATATTRRRAWIPVVRPRGL